MRYAILADIHANLEALSVVLTQLEQERVDKILCLGDLVGYHANPNECLDLVRRHGIFCIAGNHDRVAIGKKEPTRFGKRGKHAINWTKRQLTQENIQFLEQLPIFDVVDDRFLLVHGALHPEPNEDGYLLTESEVMKSFDVLRERFPHIKICLFAQTHLSGAFEYYQGVLSMTNSYRVKIKPDALYLLNPGSVGKSHNYRDSRAAFMIFNSDTDELQHYRLSFDMEACQKKSKESGLLYREGVVARSASRVLAAVKRRLPS